MVFQVAAVVEYAIDNAMETFLPAVLQLLASLLELDRMALMKSSEGKGLFVLRHILWWSSKLLTLDHAG